MSVRRRFVSAAFAAVLAVWLSATPSTAGATDGETPLVVGIDHVPLAVRDLETAAERYRALGFVLKPGREHANGIRNQHVKFRDGTEIELITAPEARDGLTAVYRRHLAGGDGPVFLGLYAPDLDALARRLDALGRPFARSGGLLVLSGDLDYLFFGPRNRTPTDRPEHFRHPNGAERVTAVWIAGDDLLSETRLLESLGASVERRTVAVPDRTELRVLVLPRAELRLLPAARRTSPGRKIVGLTLSVADLAVTRRALAGVTDVESRPTDDAAGASVFVPPDAAHGTWLEFRRTPGGTSP